MENLLYKIKPKPPIFFLNQYSVFNALSIGRASRGGGGLALDEMGVGK